MTAADVNNDRRPDVLLGYTEGPHSVFLDDGTGRGLVEVRIGDGAGAAYGFAVGYVNREPLPDVALASSGAPNVLFLGGRSQKLP